MGEKNHFLKAYEIMPTHGWSIEPAPRARDWMDATPRKAAYWCLPVTMANQAGWVVRLPSTLKVKWSGKNDPSAISLEFGDDGPSLKGAIWTNFGAGIVSFALPWLFRTNEGLGLWVRGMPNEYMPDCVPLEGLVETDWLQSGFTMNYRIIKRNTTVYFKKGMAICLLAPIMFDLFESFDASFHKLSDNPELAEGFKKAREKRAKQLKLAKPDEDMLTSKGEMKPVLDYMKGVKPAGEGGSPWHRQSFELDPFKGANG